MDESLNPLYRIVEVQDARVIELVLPMDLEALEFDSLNEVLADHIAQGSGTRWVVDLMRVRYIGSALLGMLINIRTKVRMSRGTLVLCGMNPDLERVVRIGNMEQLFLIVDTRDAAITV